MRFAEKTANWILDRKRRSSAKRRCDGRLDVEGATVKGFAEILGELREMPFDQIVELLGTSRGAAYKMLHDARRALKKRLHEFGITGADIRNAFY